MKHQQVSVDYWAMGKAMIMYAVITVLGWIMLRLFNTVFTLPRRMRAQQQNIQQTLEELQKKFPGMNITEEDLKNAEKELEEFIKEEEDKKSKAAEITEGKTETDIPKESTSDLKEDKKTI